MPDLAEGMSQRKLSEMFEWIESGVLALPELQRPLVWGIGKIPALLDSLYLDYPFGIMLLWTPGPGQPPIVSRPFEHLAAGSEVARKPAAHYLIDGQQRLTSFYRALHDPVGVRTAFNVVDEEFALVDGTIRGMLANPKKHGWYALRALLKAGPPDLAKIRREQNLEDLNEAKFGAIFGPQGQLARLLPQNIPVNFYNIRGRGYHEAVEIFERINLGTPVKESQIALGKLSEFYPGIVGDVEQYLAESKVRHGSSFDLDFFMTTLATVARDSAELAPLPNSYRDEDDLVS